MSIKLYLKDTDACLGTLTEEELAVLINVLEEEDINDQDYYLDPDVLDLMQEKGASESLVSLLRSAIGESEGVEVRWGRT